MDSEITRAHQNPRIENTYRTPIFTSSIDRTIFSNSTYYDILCTSKKDQHSLNAYAN